MSSPLRRILTIVAVFVLIMAFLVLCAIRPKSDATGATLAPDAGATKGDAGGRIHVSMLYSPEKKEWIEEAAVSFRKEHPEIKLNLVSRGAISAGEAIVEEKEAPTIFSPADTMILNMTAADWKAKGRGDLFALEGEDAPASLVTSPLVWVAWQDRADILLKASKGPISWTTLHKAIASSQGWSAIGGEPAWGFAKLGQTDPTLTSSGLFALYLMTLEYYGKPSVEMEDLLKPEYQTWVKEIEKGVTKFETSAGTFMTDMVRFGPSKYDISVVYENLAILQIENAQGRWGNLKVYYPQTTLSSDHPAAILAADWVTEPERRAARKWLAYLRSRPIQEKALALGFRPGDTSVPVKTGDAQNPWTRLAQYGIQVEIPPVAKTPDGPLARNLMTMWRRLVATDSH
jgi:ABC-type glycerol-3-phosphate transport system substrate-binding protein